MPLALIVVRAIAVTTSTSRQISSIDGFDTVLNNLLKHRKKKKESEKLIVFVDDLDRVFAALASENAEELVVSIGADLVERFFGYYSRVDDKKKIITLLGNYDKDRGKELAKRVAKKYQSKMSRLGILLLEYRRYFGIKKT